MEMIKCYRERPEVTAKCQFIKNDSWHNPFFVRASGTNYQVESFNFYKPDGTVEIKTNCGWFWGDRGSNNAYWGIELVGCPAEIVRRSGKQIKYDGKVFGVPVKDFMGETRLQVFIPVSYLESMGGGLKVTRHPNYHGNFKTCIMTDYVTPYFHIPIQMEYEDQVDQLKADMLEKLRACETREEIKAFMDDFKYKV